MSLKDNIFDLVIQWHVRRADNLTTFMYLLSWNLEASTSWNPQSPSRPVIGLLKDTMTYRMQYNCPIIVPTETEVWSVHLFSVAPHKFSGANMFTSLLQSGLPAR